MRARRIIAGSATGVLGIGILTVGVLGVEAYAATRRTYVSTDSAPPVEGRFGTPPAGVPPLRLVMLGDSTAAGLGVTRTSETVGGRLSNLLAATGRPVVLDGVGVSGSRAADLNTQVSRALLHGEPDIAVILIGANDALHATAPAAVVRDLTSAIRRLRRAGVTVVVGTCPDLGAARAFAQPLREVTAWSGRRIAAAQQTAVQEAGGAAVDLAARTGPVFRADPGTLSEDGYHPSADGYNLWALALYPAVFEAATTRPIRR